MKILKLRICTLLIISISLISSCKKESEESCKTCTARSRTTEQLISQQQACSESEEAAFRSQYPEAIVNCQ